MKNFCSAMMNMMEMCMCACACLAALNFSKLLSVRMPS